MNSEIVVQRSMEHAWRYFELHAQQRMTVFNFYLAISGLLAAGIGMCLQQGPKFSLLISILGVFLSWAVAGAECNTVIELTQEHHIA